jgi:hypothetical protein
MSEIKIITEHLPGSFHAEYQKHFNSIKDLDTGLMTKDNILELSTQIYSLLNKDDLEIHISETPINHQEIYITPQEERLHYQIVEEVSNYINKKLLDAKIITIYTIISSISLEERTGRLKIILDFDTVDFDFEEDDIQIQMVKDYIEVKNQYGLTSIEMEKLSKKQKRFLLYNLKKNNQKNA